MSRWFLTAKELGRDMKKRIASYLNKYKDREIKELLERHQFSGRFICPYCRGNYPEIPYFLDHFKYYKHRWELRLLNRIREWGPRKIPYVYGNEDDEGEHLLEEQIRFWMLALKVHEAISSLPIWREDENWASKNYVNRIFWEVMRKEKGVQSKL